MITMKEIGKIAGVSQPTVSAVLNNKDYCYVSEAKKKLVIETAHKMGYVPNLNSRALLGLSTKTIGICSSLFSVSVNTKLISDVTHEIWKHGYQTLLGDTLAQKEKEEELIREFLSRGVDALILSCFREKGELEAIMDRKIPIVIIAQSEISNYGYSTVHINKRKGGFLATEHLIRHGHENIAFVTTDLNPNLSKFKGACDAFEATGINRENLILIDGKIDELPAKSLKLISDKKVKAFFASNDIIAAKLIKFFQQNGLNLPEDAAVIGFDGLEWGEFLNPSLTTVVQPVEELAVEMVELLMEKIRGPEKDSKKHISVEPSLMIGNSCGCRKGRV